MGKSLFGFISKLGIKTSVSITNLEDFSSLNDVGAHVRRFFLDYQGKIREEKKNGLWKFFLKFVNLSYVCM